jgi:hypothetical protein
VAKYASAKRVAMQHQNGNAVLPSLFHRDRPVRSIEKELSCLFHIHKRLTSVSAHRWRADKAGVPSVDSGLLRRLKGY